VIGTTGFKGSRDFVGSRVHVLAGFGTTGFRAVTLWAAGCLGSQVVDSRALSSRVVDSRVVGSRLRAVGFQSCKLLRQQGYCSGRLL
jgi:hypothetical protein